MPYKRLKVLKAYLDIVLRVPLRRLYLLGFRPTHLTLVSSVFGLSGAWLVFSHPHIGGFLVLAYFCLDFLDGTMARVNDCVSSFGEKLDFFVDLSVASVFLVGLYVFSGMRLLPVTGLALILAVGFEEAGFIRR